MKETAQGGRRVYGPAAPSLEVTAHPGALLAEELAERGMTQSALAKAAGRPFKAINEIVNGKKAITAETAIQLETRPRHLGAHLDEPANDLRARQGPREGEVARAASRSRRGDSRIALPSPAPHSIARGRALGLEWPVAPDAEGVNEGPYRRSEGVPQAV